MQIRVITWAVLLIVFLVSPSFGTGIYDKWNVKGTVILEDESAFAILENVKDRTIRLIQAGDTLDGVKVVRIERDRVIVIIDNQEAVLQAGIQPGTGSTSAASTTAAGGASQSMSQISHQLASPPRLNKTNARAIKFDKEENDFKKHLTEEMMSLSRTPIPLSPEDHEHLVNDLTSAVSDRYLEPQSAAYLKDNQEKKVTGIVAASDIQTMGISKGDLIIHVNGIFLSSQERWGDILDAVQNARLVTYSFVSGKDVHSRVLKKQ